MIQQNVAARPVTVFRFPPRTRLKALSHATVSALYSYDVSSFHNHYLPGALGRYNLVQLG